MRINRVKKFCPLCKDVATEKVADYTYRCYRCGYIVNEKQGQSAYHKQVLVAKPSIVSLVGKDKYLIKDKDEPTRSEMLTRLNRDINKERYDRNSMLDPRKKIQPGKVINSDLWMSATYASMDTDAVTKEKQEEFHRNLKTSRYL